MCLSQTRKENQDVGKMLARDPDSDRASGRIRTDDRRFTNSKPDVHLVPSDSITPRLVPTPNQNLYLGCHTVLGGAKQFVGKMSAKSNWHK